MITLNLSKEEIEELFVLWRSGWDTRAPDEEDTLGVKISDAYIHRDDNTEPEREYETVLCGGSPTKCISKRETLGWEFVSMAMNNHNQYILLFRKWKLSCT